MQSSWIITDYRLTETRSIFADEMTICVHCAADHFGLGLRKIEPIFIKYACIDYIVVFSDLDL